MNSDHRRLADLAAILRDFQGREYSGPLSRETWFFADLGFTSIDAVVLGERLEEHLGQKLPFNRFLAELGRQQAQDIQVGQLLDFLHEQVP